MKLLGIAAIVASLGLTLGTAEAQQAAAPPPPAPTDYSKVTVITTDLGQRTYMLAGAGGNMTLIVGSNSSILVDDEFAPMYDKIKSAIHDVAAREPVTYVVNTHYHGDHTGGNEAFSKDGAIIVAHANVATRLAAGTINAAGVKTPPAPADALPVITYNDQLPLQAGGRSIVITHVPNAHTDGDSFVQIADADVLATGDIVSFGRYPNIDVVNGGSINGMIAGADALLKLADDKTEIVPGHGPLGDKAALTDYRAMLGTARDRVAALITGGKSIDDIVAAKPLSDLDAKVSATPAASDNFVRLIYQSLTATASAAPAAAAGP